MSDIIKSARWRSAFSATLWARLRKAHAALLNTRPAPAGAGNWDCDTPAASSEELASGAELGRSAGTGEKPRAPSKTSLGVGSADTVAGEEWCVVATRYERERDIALQEVQRLMKQRDGLDNDLSAEQQAHAETKQALAAAVGPKAEAVTWFYAPASDSEDWNGPHNSLEDALDAARSDYTGAIHEFWVDEARAVDWEAVARGFVDADDLLDRFADYIGDNEHVEDPEPEFKVSRKSAQAALEAWAVEHLQMREYWQCIGKPAVYPVKPSVESAIGAEASIDHLEPVDVPGDVT